MGGLTGCLTIFVMPFLAGLALICAWWLLVEGGGLAAFVIGGLSAAGVWGVMAMNERYG